jgi:hypothetical protein
MNAGPYPGDPWTFDGNKNYNVAAGSVDDAIAKANNTVSISNIPAAAVYQGSFMPTFTTLGDGAKSTASLTPAICTITGNTVNFVAVGTCRLQASVTEGTNYKAATGDAQSFDVGKAPGSVSISNIPGVGVAVVGASFTPTYTKLGDGVASTASLTPAICSVGSAGLVSFLTIGACNLQAAITAGTNYLAASGTVQTFSAVYNFNGFFQPINSDLNTCNVVKAGSAIPVKFSLDGNKGLSAVASITIANGSCVATASDPITDAETVAASTSGLTYDATADQYVYVWKTDKSFAGSAKRLTVTLADGSAHAARFSFTK